MVGFRVTLYACFMPCLIQLFFEKFQSEIRNCIDNGRIKFLWLKYIIFLPSLLSSRNDFTVNQKSECQIPNNIVPQKKQSI